MINKRTLTRGALAAIMIPMVVLGTQSVAIALPSETSEVSSFTVKDYRGERLDIVYKKFSADGGKRIAVLDASGKKRKTIVSNNWYVSRQSIAAGTKVPVSKQLIVYVVNVKDSNFVSSAGSMKDSASIESYLEKTMINLTGAKRVSKVVYKNGNLSLTLALNNLFVKAATKFAAWMDIHTIFKVAQAEKVTTLTITGTLESENSMGASLGQQPVLLVSFNKTALTKGEPKNLFGSKLGTIASKLEYYGSLK